MNFAEAPPDLPDNYLSEIGRVVVYWNRLESLIVHTLVVALSGDFTADGRALAVIAHTSFPQKLDALGTMLRIIDENLAEIYRVRVEHLLRQSQEKRNAALHQEWLLDDDLVKRLNIKARGILKITLHPVSIQELTDVSQFIDEAYFALLRLITIPLGDRAIPQQGQ